MKIDGNDLKVGDIVWYEFAYEYKQGTIKEISFNVANPPLIIMDNGDGIFVDDGVFYTEKSDITNEMIDEIVFEARNAIRFWNNEIIAASTRIAKTFDKIERMQVFNK